MFTTEKQIGNNTNTRASHVKIQHFCCLCCKWEHSPTSESTRGCCVVNVINPHQIGCSSVIPGIVEARNYCRFWFCFPGTTRDGRVDLFPYPSSALNKKQKNYHVCLRCGLEISLSSLSPPHWVQNQPTFQSLWILLTQSQEKAEADSVNGYLPWICLLHPNAQVIVFRAQFAAVIDWGVARSMVLVYIPSLARSDGQNTPSWILGSSSSFLCCGVWGASRQAELDVLWACGHQFWYCTQRHPLHMVFRTEHWSHQPFLLREHQHHVVLDQHFSNTVSLNEQHRMTQNLPCNWTVADDKRKKHSRAQPKTWNKTKCFPGFFDRC